MPCIRRRPEVHKVPLVRLYKTWIDTSIQTMERWLHHLPQKKIFVSILGLINSLRTRALGHLLACLLQTPLRKGWNFLKQSSLNHLIRLLDGPNHIYSKLLDGLAGISSPLITLFNQSEAIGENFSYIYSAGKSTEKWSGSVFVHSQSL